MKKLVLPVWTFLIFGFITNQYHLNGQSRAAINEFTEKFSDHIGEGEEVIESWYHFVKIRDASGKYILRIFYPETKQIISEVRYSDESFSVSHGLAKYWHENGNLKSTGNYKSNVTVGEWRFYDRKTGKLSSKGLLNSDKKEGSWKNYDTKGRLTSEITYVKNISNGGFIEYDSLGHTINVGIYKDGYLMEQTAKLDVKNIETLKPILSSCKSEKDFEQREKCTEAKMLKFIYTNLKYPVNAYKYGVEGTVIIHITVDKNGDIQDTIVEVGICQEFEEECLRVLSMMPPWEAGTQNGKKVEMKYTIPIRYKLESR